MSNIEHYFENLLYESYKNPEDDINRTLMTKDEINAVEICADYIKYSLFGSLNDFRHFRKMHEIISKEKTGRWIYDELKGWCCSECGNQAPFWCLATTQNLTGYCPNCGARMVE